MPLLLVAVIGMLWLWVTVRGGVFGFTALSTRGAFVLAFALFEVLVVTLTEGASIGHHFTRPTIAGSWALILMALVVAVFLDARRLAGRGSLLGPIRARFFSLAGKVDCATLSWIAVLIVIFGVLCVLGWLYPPNNADSHAYHLSRVEHWIQNRSVAHYAAHYLAQIEMAPLSSFNLAHLHLLSGGSDQFDGYLQWYAMLVCVVGASEMARLLGGDRMVQTIAAVLCATLPSVILEATSTQNNDFTAAVGVSLCVLLLAWGPASAWPQRGALLGFITGLAVLAKGTLPMLIAPAATVLLIAAIRRESIRIGFAGRLRRTALMLLAGGACALATAGPFLWRNMEVFGRPTGPVSRTTLSYSLTLKAAIANVVRSTTANFMIGDGMSGADSAVSRVVLKWCLKLHQRLGLAMDDPRYFMGTRTEFDSRDFSTSSRDEACGANPWHAVLSGIAILFLAIGAARGRREHFLPLLFGLALLSGLIVFTGIARWSIYGVRYQIPSLVAFCPLIGIALASVHRRALAGAGLIAGISCLPQLVDNASRPLLRPSHAFASPLSPYFFGYEQFDPLLRPHRAEAYEAITEAIATSSCRQVGLATWLRLEYPFWAGLRLHHWRGTVHCVELQNESRGLERRDFHPTAWVREEDPSYIAPDDGRLHLRFDRLALAMAPGAMDAARTKVLGFKGAGDDVQVLPGGGWSQPINSKRMTLTGSGSLYLYAKAFCKVRLAFRGAAPDSFTARMEQPGGATLLANGDVTADFPISQGITRIKVSATGGNAPGNERLELTEVAVIVSKE